MVIAITNITLPLDNRRAQPRSLRTCCSWRIGIRYPSWWSHPTTRRWKPPGVSCKISLKSMDVMVIWHFFRTCKRNAQEYAHKWKGHPAIPKTMNYYICHSDFWHHLISNKFVSIHLCLSQFLMWYIFFFWFANYIQLSKGFREIQRDTNVGFFIPSYQSDGWNIHQARNEIRPTDLGEDGAVHESLAWCLKKGLLSGWAFHWIGWFGLLGKISSGKPWVFTKYEGFRLIFFVNQSNELWGEEWEMHQKIQRGETGQSRGFNGNNLWIGYKCGIFHSSNNQRVEA